MTEPNTGRSSRVTSQDVSEALSQGIGGTRGILDSGLPTAVFLVVYVLTGQNLMPSVWAAGLAGVLVAVFRVVRREPLQQIVGGLVGLAIAAFLAARTGRAEDFFLPGILTNVAYGTVFAISALVRRPLIGYVAGAVTGDVSGWRSDPAAVRAANAASWLWAGMFGLRVLVQFPLYLAGAVEALGAAKLVMGWPLFILVSFLTYRLMEPAMSRMARHGGTSESDADHTEPRR